jgi:hypothetical protein
MRRSLWNGTVFVPTGPATVLKKGTGSTTGCTCPYVRPLLVVVPVPFFSSLPAPVDTGLSTNEDRDTRTAPMTDPIRLARMVNQIARLNNDWRRLTDPIRLVRMVNQIARLSLATN